MVTRRRQILMTKKQPLVLRQTIHKEMLCAEYEYTTANNVILRKNP